MDTYLYHAIHAIHMAVSLCNQCGYRWNHSQRIPDRCPSCKSTSWNQDAEPESCSMDGGICDQCGCKFFTSMMKANFCPHCGSDKWDSGATTGATTRKTFECLKCGYVWNARPGKTPTKCPHWSKALGKKDCGSRKIREVLE